MKMIAFHTLELLFQSNLVSRLRTMHFATVYLSAKLFKSLRMYSKRFSLNLISGKVAHILQISLDKYCTAYCPKCAPIVFSQK